MSSSKKKTPADELLESLLNDLGSSENSEGKSGDDPGIINLDLADEEVLGVTTLKPKKMDDEFSGLLSMDATRAEAVAEPTMIGLSTSVSLAEDEPISLFGDDDKPPAKKSNSLPPLPNNQRAASVPAEPTIENKGPSLLTPEFSLDIPAAPDSALELQSEPEVNEVVPEEYSSNEATVAIGKTPIAEPVKQPPAIDMSANGGDSDKTVAVTGYQIKIEDDLEDKVKVSVGKQSRSSGFVSWGGSVDGSLGQAENLKMAQEKILELENENEKLRRQNGELIAASEIIKERSDLLTSQLTEFKNDRDGLEQSFKNEMILLKNHLSRKDAELQRAQFKVDELESRLKFDMKKIRVRERELENRLELVRAEKNAIAKNKDEQILDLRRKMDIIQMEVDSYRQKCIDLNKQIEASQDSFKRTTRALRLAMANLELHEENKTPLKKAE
jgi:hypothetical protein